MQGAVYVTKNAAYSWQAAVQESVDATLNRTVSSGPLFCHFNRPYLQEMQGNPLLPPASNGDSSLR